MSQPRLSIIRQMLPLLSASTLKHDIMCWLETTCQDAALSEHILSTLNANAEAFVMDGGGEDYEEGMEEVMRRRQEVYQLGALTTFQCEGVLQCMSSLLTLEDQIHDIICEVVADYAASWDRRGAEATIREMNLVNLVSPTYAFTPLMDVGLDGETLLRVAMKIVEIMEPRWKQFQAWVQGAQVAVEGALVAPGRVPVAN